ncbi:EamA family transporter [Pseudonocardia acidicola]|uniref:DMT family transporter n=1 Tax=Pseudonocardia acidicola TaxID=2724939 RepID=A0ABX1S6Z1_9PSEU|nr:DMT family transporter [Pseudonocardia acidicola]
MGEALALLALALFSSNVLLVKIASPRLGQDIGFLIGLASNVVFSGLLFLGERRLSAQPFHIEWRPFVMFVIGGLFTAYLGRRLFFRTVQTIGPSRASALQITNPVVAGIISWLFLGEVLGPSAILFVALVVGGLYLTSQVPARAAVTVAPGTGDVPTGTAPAQPSDSRPAEAPPASRSGTLPRRELMLGLVGAGSYAVGNVIRSSAVRDWNEAVFGGFLGAIAATLAYLLLHTRMRTLIQRIREADRVGVALWGLSGVLTISAQISLIASTRHIPVAVGVVVAAAIPVLVIPASLALFRNSEAITVRTAVGSLLILGGVAGLILT